MKTKIIIRLDKEHSVEEAMREVLRQIKEGYTSGYNPTWEVR